MIARETTKNNELIYEGSVKRLLRSSEEDNRIWFHFTDDYSVFDWGKMPDTIANKGSALTFIGAFFFETLAKAETWKSIKQSPAFKRIDADWLSERFSHDAYRILETGGLANHYVRLVQGGESKSCDTFEPGSREPVYMEVLEAELGKATPASIHNQTVYFYDHADRCDRFVVPLEVVFRFGMPQGSSLKAKLEKDPGYRKTLGLTSEPKEGEWFDRPVLEFFTKREPTDRRLGWSEAALLSGLSASDFELLVEYSFDIALALYAKFAAAGLELWDGKFEFVFDKTNSRSPILLADSIGPDELRLIYRHYHLSKELLRVIYRDSDWAHSVSEAKQIAAERAVPEWKRICIEELKKEPAPLSVENKAVIDSLYGVLANQIAGRRVFPDHPDLDGFIALIDGVHNLKREARETA